MICNYEYLNRDQVDYHERGMTHDDLISGFLKRVFLWNNLISKTILNVRIRK
jgi:hypothetical protein